MYKGVCHLSLAATPPATASATPPRRQRSLVSFSWKPAGLMRPPNAPNA